MILTKTKSVFRGRKPSEQLILLLLGVVFLGLICSYRLSILIWSGHGVCSHIHLAEMRILLNLQLWEKLVALLELRSIIGRKAIFGHFLRSLALVSILQEMTVSVVSLNPACDGEHSWPIVDSDHQVVDLFKLWQNWSRRFAYGWTWSSASLALLFTCCLYISIVEFDANLIGIYVYVLCCMFLLLILMLIGCLRDFIYIERIHSLHIKVFLHYLVGLNDGTASRF